MIEIKNKALCSGCHSCFNICPQQCIKMTEDSEGFLYPVIDKEKCIDCGLCEKACPIINGYDGKYEGKAYACINKNDEMREESSSGGIFTLIATEILKAGGVVFGAAFDEELNVNHIEVVCKEDLEFLRGSKYLQSCIGDAYKKVESYLKEGRFVLFSGTPCQISGLKRYLKKDYDNLILQDIICHGVPSHLSWESYLNHQKKLQGKMVDNTIKPKFRSKIKGWKTFSVSIAFENGISYNNTFDKDLYMKAFLNNLSLRPSCYDCHSKSIQRESDITLADFWGIENILPEMFDDKGTSLVLVNSKKGCRLFESIAEKMIYKEVSIDEAIKHNPSAIKSVIRPKNRDKFMKMILNTDFDKAVNECLKVSVVKRSIIKFKIIIKRMCQNVQK